MSDSENARHQRFLAAAKRFESGEISYGKAAESAGMSKIDLIEMCGVYREAIEKTFQQIHAENYGLK